MHQLGSRRTHIMNMLHQPCVTWRLLIAPMGTCAATSKRRLRVLRKSASSSRYILFPREDAVYRRLHITARRARAVHIFHFPSNYFLRIRRKTFVFAWPNTVRCPDQPTTLQVVKIQRRAAAVAGPAASEPESSKGAGFCVFIATIRAFEGDRCGEFP
ncbi:hypothetical protein BD310DRAFT_259135 [Dichomitus squalens]|uniref:Uncharacterized protein n=1 Tax=Dichomitus squalens TaxID=114155 RepID=A0A4Q9PGF4_9APHY|nr:hypothetical protein BD310DRAFT_259135 [Dichomitus squalens]